MAVSVWSPTEKEAKRVSKDEAKRLVATGQWRYVSKNEYQRLVSGQQSAVAD